MIRVPTNHCYEKRFYVSLQEAFHTWGPDILERIKEKKKHRHDLTDDEVNSDAHFNARW